MDQTALNPEENVGRDATVSEGASLTTTPNTDCVIVTDVVHGYTPGTTVVDNVSLAIRAGEVHCLLGPSGSGKTTLLRLIAGLERLRSGQITIAGELVESATVHLPPEKRKIGYVFQDFALFPHLSIRRNVMYGMWEPNRRQRRKVAGEWLARVGLGDYADAMPHTLSGGQQQRVALVRALARDPAVMLLDEPFSGLDVEMREKIRTETFALLRSAKVATLMVTHDPHKAYVSADQISAMNRGRITLQGTPDQVCQLTKLPSGLQVIRVNAAAASLQSGDH